MEELMQLGHQLINLREYDLDQPGAGFSGQVVYGSDDVVHGALASLPLKVRHWCTGARKRCAA